MRATTEDRDETIGLYRYRLERPQRLSGYVASAIFCVGELLKQAPDCFEDPGGEDVRVALGCLLRVLGEAVEEVHSEIEELGEDPTMELGNLLPTRFYRFDGTHTLSGRGHTPMVKDGRPVVMDADGRLVVLEEENQRVTIAIPNRKPEEPKYDPEMLPPSNITVIGAGGRVIQGAEKAVRNG